MRKSKRREKLRDNIVSTRGRAGRPLEPPRNEKESIERARAYLNSHAESQAKKLHEFSEHEDAAIALRATESHLDRVGVSKKVEITVPLSAGINSIIEGLETQSE